MSVPVRTGLLIAAVASFAANGYADQFHYRNVIIGDRAVGLGGAYAGVSDDASGVYYNPGGLAFALSNDISGSANAFYRRTVRYKKAIGGEDFTEKSGGSVPSFFGGLQKLDQQKAGLVAAFGVYSTDSDLKDQDNLIKDQSLGSVNIDRFHRTVNLRASTVNFGGAAAMRVGSNFGVGFGLSYFTVDELVQEFQDAMLRGSNFCIDPTPDANGNVPADNPRYDCMQVTSQNIRQYLTAYGVEPVLGIQWALGGRFSVGLAIKKGILIGEKLEVSRETRVSDYTLDDANSLNSRNGKHEGRGGPKANSSRETLAVIDTEKPLGGMPMETRLGGAWFYSTRLLMTLDLIHHGAAKSGQAIYNREAVLDIAAGSEYYLTPSLPLRFGIFTNKDARPQVAEGKTGQPDHIDYLGESLFLAWVQPNSQISVGAVWQQGKGKAQKLANSANIQEVEALARTFAFSASHNF